MRTRGQVEAFAQELAAGTAQEPVLELLRTASAELADRTSPSAAFRDDTRVRLLAVAAVRSRDTTPERSPRSLRVTWARRAAAVCAALVVVAVAAVGISIPARHALPGDALYGVKRATEALELRTTSGNLDQGLKRLHLAETRLAEVRALAAGSGGSALGSALGSARDGSVLAGGGRSDLIRSTLAAMDADTRAGSGLVEQAALAGRTQVPLVTLQAWSGQQGDRLRSVAPTLPTTARDRLAASLTLVEDLAARTTELLKGH